MGNTNYLGHTAESRQRAIDNAYQTIMNKTHQERSLQSQKAAATKMGLSLSVFLQQKEERLIRRKLAHNIRTQLYNYLHGRSGLLRHVAWTVDDLKTHLESKFEYGMSWANYGRKSGIKCWEIDHVIPLNARINGEYIWKSLDDPNSNDFKQVWSLNNLQPMWAKENNSKNNRILPQ
jgi:hypothetical protein